MSRRNGLIAAALVVALAGFVAAQGISIPNTFINGTSADANAVNANFAALASNALNRTGGTMTGDLKFSGDNLYDIGKAGATRPRNLFLGGSATIDGTLTVAGIVGGWTVVTTTAAGTVHNFALGLSTNTILRCTGAGPLTLTGLVGGGIAGQHLLIVNESPWTVDTLPQNAGSSAANRFINVATTITTSMTAGAGSAHYVYDATQSRWRLVAHEQGAWLPWTPSWSGTGGQSGQVYSTQTGQYRLSGRTMQVQGRLALTTRGTITGQLQIAGLPATVAATNYYGFTVNYVQTLTTAVVWIGGFIPPAGTVLVPQMLTAAATGYANLAQADLANTTDFMFTGSYETP